MNESRFSTSKILISASRVISLILISPSRQAILGLKMSLGRLSKSTRLLMTTPLTSLDSLRDPVPIFFIEICSADISSLFFETIVSASTMIGANRSRAASATLPRSAVSATARSLSSLTGEASESDCERLVASAISYPSTKVSGCNPFLKRVSASNSNAPHNNIVVVTPSPQASSWDSAMETIILAAGCLIRSSATILAPSLVTAVDPSVL